MPPTPRLRRLLVGSLVGGLATIAVPAAVAPADASSSYLCTGYAGCKAAGYSDAGYGAHNRSMYWLMYSGHNCTNYVAYRMVQAGMPNKRPWSGSGNATNWGPANPDITDQTPAVGAVAWFSRGLAGGADGHVAYVEKVISPTQIVISEDSWSGDFHWAVLTKDGGTWPTGFIHFVDQKTIEPGAAPTVTAAPQVGKPVSVARGVWKPAGATFAYQWRADGVAIPGATTRTFTPTADQLGTALSATVTATKSGYVTAAATTEPTADVLPGALSSTAAPVVTGDGVVGQELTVQAGTWAPTPDQVGIRWRADGHLIKGAYESTLTLTKDLVGKTITADEVVRKQGYVKTTGTSEGVGPIVAGVIDTPDPFHAQGTPKYGNTLTITPGTVTPSDADVAYAWSRDGSPVAGATQASYHLGADDLGHVITATVTFTKPKFATVVRHYDFVSAVTSHPAITLSATPKKRAAVAAGRLVAPGIGPITGSVTVSVGQHHATAPVKDGRFWTRMTGLGAGLRRVVVTYNGGTGASAAKTSQKVNVQR